MIYFPPNSPNLVISPLFIQFRAQSHSFPAQNHLLHILLFSAPSYCGQHSVGTQGWNYPRQGQQQQQDPVDQAHTVDLGAHPPYHPPPQGLKVKIKSFKHQQNKR